MKGSRGLKLLSVGALVTVLGLAAMVAGEGQVQAQQATQGCGNWSVWTTNKDGKEVNGNEFSSKADVYLNGGPNNRLSHRVPAGTYSYIVAEPSGKPLYSAPRSLSIVDGADLDGWGEFPGIPLADFADTSNPGGEYKVIVTLGDCSKSDNFWVRQPATSTPTVTPTAASTSTSTATPTATATVGSSPTATATATAGGTSTTATATPTATGTSTTATATATATGTPVPPTATPTQASSSGGGGDNGGGGGGGDSGGSGTSPTNTPVPTATPVVVPTTVPAATAVPARSEPPAVAGIEPPTPPVETPEAGSEGNPPPALKLVVQPEPVPAQPNNLPSAGEADSGPAGWLLAGGLFLMMSGLLLRTREIQSVQSQ